MALINQTLQQPPDDATHWSTRRMAEAIGVSHMTVHRVWSAFGIQPHRQRHFKISTDPYFAEKVRDIVGLYLSTRRTRPWCCASMRKARCRRSIARHRCRPRGWAMSGESPTTTSAMAPRRCSQRWILPLARSWPRARIARHQEFLAFLRHIEANVPAELDVPLVLDNYASHKHPKVRAWLARPPPFHRHFTPTYASWLNQVERWFAHITERAIRRGSFKSVKELVQRVDAFVEQHNRRCAPFTWYAGADSILAKVERLCERISVTGH